MNRPLFVVAAVSIAVFVGRNLQGVAPPCGDVNGDAAVNITDPVHVLNFLFLGEPAPECASGSPSCANVNGDTVVNLTDAVYLLNWLFLSGPEPVCTGGPQVIEGFTFTKANEQGYPEYTHDQTGIIFVRLPGGKFNMGSQRGEPESEDDEGPVHEVTLSPFLVGKYEVTQGQWHAVMGNYPASFDGTKDWNGNPIDPPDDRDNLPVESVSWDDIQGFEEKTGLALPTEAQWEYAARAGTETAFCFGLGEGCADWECGGCAERDPFMWYCGNSAGGPCRQGGACRTHEVGTRVANAFGLHDVHGGVWEWCEDVYEGRFYSKPEAAGPDPLSTSGSEYRVFRGGSWVDRAAMCRSAERLWNNPWGHGYGIGFRPAFRLVE